MSALDEKGKQDPPDVGFLNKLNFFKYLYGIQLTICRMADTPNTTPFGQDRKTLTFKLCFI